MGVPNNNVVKFTNSAQPHDCPAVSPKIERLNNLRT